MFDTRRQPPQRGNGVYDGEDPKLKELLNQPAPSRTDAEEYRQTYAANRGSAPAGGVNSNPNYPGIAEQFNEQRYGVRNPTVSYKQSVAQSTANVRTKDKNGVAVTYGPTKQTANKRSSTQTVNQNVAPSSPSYVRPTNIPKVTRKKGKKLKDKNAFKKTSVAIGHAKGIAIGFWSSAWALNTWLYVQIPLAILSIVGLGFWYYIESLKGSTDLPYWQNILVGVYVTFEKAFNAGIKLLTGWDIESLTALFFLTYVALLTFVLLTVFITIFGFLASFCRPLSGKMSVLKWGTLVLCIVGYLIPGLNLFPWILLYIWVVAIYPR